MRRLGTAWIAGLGLAIAACQPPVADIRLTAGTPPSANPIKTSAASSAAPLQSAVPAQPAPSTLNAPTRTAAWPTPAATTDVGTPVTGNLPKSGTSALTPVGRPLTPVTGPRNVPSSLIVTLQDGADEAAVLAAPGAMGFVREDALTLGSVRMLSLHTPAGVALGEAIARLRAVPGVLRVSENAVRRRTAFSFTKPDPRYGEQWAHRPDRANTEAAWAVVPAASQSKIIAAVLDSGLDVTHPEFAGRIQGASDFSGAQQGTTVQDDVGHGTHVTGILAAAGNNGQGVAGVAWGVQILPVKVLDKDGNGTDFNILKGFAYAIKYLPVPDDGSRVRVLNMSLGSDDGRVSEDWVDAMAAANAAGIVVVGAAGNLGQEFVGTPANTPGVLAVGSTGNYLAWEHLSSFSNYGNRLDLTAPGEAILSTLPVLGGPQGQLYGYASGTSMAAPFVAGVAALVTARYDPTNAQVNASFARKVRQRLTSAVDDLGPPGPDPLYGAGRINAYKAVAPASIDGLP